MTIVAVAPEQETEPKPITTLKEWREHVIQQWTSLKKEASAGKLSSPYIELAYIALSPVLPKNKTDLSTTRKLISNMDYCKPLSNLLKTIYKENDFSTAPIDIIKEHFTLDSLSTEEQIGLDWLLVSVGALSGLKRTHTKFLTDLETNLNNYDTPSAVRVQAGMISAGQNVVFAGQDVNIISQHYQGDQVALRAYLTKVRNEWDIPATNIHPQASRDSNFALHQLFTPPDIWIDTSEYSEVDLEQLTQRRFTAIEKDLNDNRRSVLEAMSIYPYIAITGGAGTGKSSLCHFIATALAYACDPKAEKKEKINGLELLGSAWIHGPLLPLYVSLRDFCNDTEAFPQANQDASATNLLKYIKKHLGSFAPHLETYLMQADVDTHGTLLLLDGLDEVYDEEHRIVLRRIIENWADRFTHSRIMLTSRTYAYRHDARWRLSKRFKSAELAPFTWRQMRRYVGRWYSYAAETRPSAFVNSTEAKNEAQLMANDLIKSIRENPSLWPLARQPLMLALLTLIHENRKYLPSKRAELYKATVELLDRWNIPSPADKLHEKLGGINLERMRAALKMIAYDLQSEQKSYLNYPTIIERGKLLEKLMQQQLIPGGLGANIEDVLEYLSTRNSIIISDTAGVYRFPHLSIQEYLAASALIEFYDECPMPKELTPATADGWKFPENIGALLRHNSYRWRGVALFAGSIIAAGQGQDSRWQLIDELLPPKLDDEIPENALYSICIASEIWAESWLKARTRAQKGTRQHLTKCLQAIQHDERIDAPERMKNIAVLARLQTEEVDD